MLKRFFWLSLSIVIVGSALFAASVWSLHQLYTVARAQIPSNAQCSTHWNWLRLQQSEHCSFTLAAEQSLQFKQKVQFLPWGLKADFSITPIYKGMHFEGQQGHWSLPLGSKRIQFNAQAKGSIHTRKLMLQPWSASGWLQLSKPYTSHVEVAVSQLKLVVQNDSLIFDDLYFSFESTSKNAQRFIDRNQLKFSKGRWLTADDLFEVQHFNLQEANLLENGVLSILADINWQGIRAGTSSTATRIDPTKMKLYFEQVAIEPTPLFQGTTFAVSLSENLRRISQQLGQQIHKKGIKVHLEEFHSGIVFQDRTPDALGLSGDFTLDGLWQVTATATKPKEQFKLNLDLNESLLYGPQLELMLDFIEEGWVYRRNGRLVSRVLYRNGKLLANGQLVSALPLWPSPYEEDH